VAGRMRIRLLIIILLLWLVETDVFQMPQLHKHFNVSGYFMTDLELIEKLKLIVGHSIVDVSYIPTKFHYSTPDNLAQGDWTNVNPDLFVLHSREWQISLSTGETLFIASEQLSCENFASNFCIANGTKATEEDKVLNIPKAFKWLDILNKPIKKFVLWQRVTTSSKFLGQEYNLKYQDHFQLLNSYVETKHFRLQQRAVTLEI
jgi:hypothetical protein